MCGKRKTQTANDNDLISVSLKSFAPLPLEGADERSEAGLASPNVGVPCTCQQKLDTKLKKLGIKIEYLYKIQ